MSLFDLSSIKTRPSRNGFDLGYHSCFTAAPGQLLPVMCKETLPGDHFEINVNALTRCQPMNTAAYVRMKEYYDFFFVPTRLLWRYFPDFVMQNKFSDSSSTEGSNVYSRTPVVAPSLVGVDMTSWCRGVSRTIRDDCGYQLFVGAQKLFDLLGYGCNFYDNLYRERFNSNNFIWSPFPLLAYQKIYQDFYRNHSWELYDSTSFNVDYLNSVGTTLTDNHVPFSMLSDFCQIRYANFKKDKFMGVRPTTQFGDVALLSDASVDFDQYLKDNGLQPEGTFDPNLYTDFVKSIRESFDAVQQQYDILSLRRAEASQRWKEVTEMNDFRYKGQVKAHFGFDVPDARAQMSEFIGGFDNPVNISDVVANSSGQSEELGIQNYLGQIGGYGTAVSDGNKKISYDSKEHGFLLCIYHCQPELDYTGFGLDPMISKFVPTDYYIPEFQNIGLSPVRVRELFFGKLLEGSTISEYFGENILGYAPRYLDYKTSVDRVHGEFNRSLDAWTVRFDEQRLAFFYDFASKIFALDYRFFKVYPSVCNSIFSVQYDGVEDSEPFLINGYFDIKAVRSMSVDGMPY